VLRSLSFETTIIEGYRRRESSVEEALIEMYLAGVSVRRGEDITQALWGTSGRLQARSVALASAAPMKQSSTVSAALCEHRLVYLRLQAALREIFWIESEDEICVPFLGTDTECIVLGVGRYFGRGANLDRFSPRSNEIDERADRCGSNVQPLQNFFVFGENIL
jgi:hypothetical protein